MNTANLQLEGLLLVLSCLIETMRRKGVLTEQEIDAALRWAETSLNDEAQGKDLSPSNLDAVQFPIRFLKAANEMTAAGQLSFAALTAIVSETKHGH